VIRKYIFPVLLSIFLVVMVVMFIFGDLGVIASYKKSKTMLGLKKSIITLERAYLQKKKEVIKLKNDKATLRKYALYYGMTGGIVIWKKAMKTTKAYDRIANEAPIIHRKGFFSRHPILLILLGGIVVLLFLFIFITKKNAVVRRDAESIPLRKNKTNRLIKPSWS